MSKKDSTNDKKQNIATDEYDEYEGEETEFDTCIPLSCKTDDGEVDEEKLIEYFKNLKAVKDTIKDAIREVKKEDEDKDKKREEREISDEKEIEEKIIAEELKGNIADLIKLWDEIFEIYSFNNPEYSRACFHLVMGMILKNCRVDRDGTKTDPRISVLYIKPTFSGGSAAFDMVEMIAKKLNFNVNTITDATDAALIGSFEKDKDSDENVMKKGILDKSKSDLVYWGEAVVIFQKNAPTHSMKTRNYLQAALNPIDSVESKLKKDLVAGIVTCDVECSLLLVSYPPKELDDDVLYSGAVQRFLFIPKALTIDGRMENINEDINRYEKKGIDIEGKIERLITMFFEIKKKYGKGVLFKMSSGATTKFKELEKELGQKYKKTDLRIQDHMGGILSSSVRKISAISLHAAAIRRDTTISNEDIEYAVSILKPQLKMIHEYLESKPEHVHHSILDEEEFNKVSIYCGKAAKTKKEFLEAIGKCLNLTSKGAKYKRFNSWMDQGLIVDTNGKIAFVK